MNSSSCPSDREGKQLFSIYVLQMADGTYYVGSTTNLAERLERHRCCGGRGRRGGGHYVEGRGMKYRRDLSPKQMCATRARAEAVEAKTAAKLRARGYDVRQG